MAGRNLEIGDGIGREMRDLMNDPMKGSGSLERTGTTIKRIEIGTEKERETRKRIERERGREIVVETVIVIELVAKNGKGTVVVIMTVSANVIVHVIETGSEKETMIKLVMKENVVIFMTRILNMVVSQSMAGRGLAQGTEILTMAMGKNGMTD